jgi:DNA-binding transcriptional regulator YhcF (GntR family)
MKHLTNTQLAYAVYIHSYLQANDNLPTRAQTAKDFGVVPNAANDMFKKLHAAGVLERCDDPLQYRFARTPEGRTHRANIIAKANSQRQVDMV